MSFSGDNSAPTSLSIIERVRQFDPEAWRRLCEIYGPLVYHWARRAGLQDDDARNIGQEVFRTVAQRIDGFRKQSPQDTFRGWLRVVTRHKLGDYLRRMRDRPLVLGGSNGAEAMAAAADAFDREDSRADIDEEARILHRALSVIRVEFEETTWQAFWRATVEEQPADLIAGDLGTSCGAVRQAKYRVRRRLRHQGRRPSVIVRQCWNRWKSARCWLSHRWLPRTLCRKYESGPCL